MSRIKGKNTKPEMLVRKFLFSKGIRYRLHAKKLPGKPDLIFPRYRMALFIHGCFWHGHEGCKYFVVPKTRTQWWVDKINKNVLNDTKAVKSLEEMDYKVLTIWECDLRSDKIETTLKKLLLEFK